jgi:hypothetical protein
MMDMPELLLPAARAHEHGLWVIDDVPSEAPVFPR